MMNKLVAIVLLAAAAVHGKFIPEIQDAIVRYPEAMKLFNIGVPGSGRIINGQVVDPKDSVPWQCRLSLVTPQGNFFCGCSVIGEQWILTAAHCTDGATSVTVTMGDHTQDVIEGTEASVTVSAAEIKIHPNWTPRTFENDLSVINVPTITFTNAIQPICLPMNAPANNHVGDKLTVTGWGKTSDADTAVSNVLYTTTVTGMTNTACAAIYGNNAIKPTTLCTDAQNDGTSTCNGDSGGPLTTLQTGDPINKPVQVGIVSFGSSLGCLAGPTGFARVSSFTGWIETATNSTVVASCPL